MMMPGAGVVTWPPVRLNDITIPLEKGSSISTRILGYGAKSIIELSSMSLYSQITSHTPKVGAGRSGSRIISVSRSWPGAPDAAPKKTFWALEWSLSWVFLVAPVVDFLPAVAPVLGHA